MIETIGNIFLFRTLNSEQSSRVAEFCSSRILASGEHLFWEGDRSDAFYYLVTGKLKVYRLSPQGTEHILEIIEPGNTVAEAAIFDRETFPASCAALAESKLVRIPAADFIALVEREPKIALKIMHAYSKRLRYFVRLVEELTMKDVRSRLAGWLLDNAEERGGRNVCMLTVSKKELASMLGTVPETLSRTFRSFREEGTIEESGRSVILSDPARLKEYLR